MPPRRLGHDLRRGSGRGNGGGGPGRVSSRNIRQLDCGGGGRWRGHHDVRHLLAAGHLGGALGRGTVWALPRVTLILRMAHMTSCASNVLTQVP